jgi:hypothetical protein
VSFVRCLVAFLNGQFSMENAKFTMNPFIYGYMKGLLELSVPIRCLIQVEIKNLNKEEKDEKYTNLHAHVSAYGDIIRVLL